MAFSDTASDEEIAAWSLLRCFGLHVTVFPDSDLNAWENCLLWPDTQRRKKVGLRHGIAAVQ